MTTEKVQIETLNWWDLFKHGGVIFVIIHKDPGNKICTCRILGEDAGVWIAYETKVTPVKIKD